MPTVWFICKTMTKYIRGQSELGFHFGRVPLQFEASTCWCGFHVSVMTKNLSKTCRRVERKWYMKVKVGDLLLLKSKGENEEHICGFLIHSFTLLFLLRSSILFIGYFAQFICLTGEGGVFSTIFKRNSAKVKTRLKLHWRHKTQEKALTPLSLFGTDPYN